VRKKCSSDQGKLSKHREFVNILRSLEQFIQTVKGLTKIRPSPSFFLTSAYVYLTFDSREREVLCPGQHRHSALRAFEFFCKVLLRKTDGELSYGSYYSVVSIKQPGCLIDTKE
jgi:hypothetical protein